jgi:hypothetical protein
MKTTLFSLLLASSVVVATAPDDPSLSGTWKVHSSIAGNDNDQTCTITQKENDLTGTCTSDQGAVNIIGKINGKKATWSYKSEYNGAPLTVAFDGLMESASKISGTVNVPEFSAEGDFTATLAK